MAILGGAACFSASTEAAGVWLDAALARGVNHLDIAPQYGDAESAVGPHLATRRDQLFVAAKTLRANPEGVSAQFDTTRRLLHADVLDLYQAHGVTTIEELDRRSEAIERILHLRDIGQTRFVGITGHDVTAPATFIEALGRFDLDTVMFPVYPALWANAPYREAATELLDICAARDLGVMAIKAVAQRPWGDGRSMGDPDRWATSWYEPAATDAHIDRGVHFALSTPGVHGFCTPGDLALLVAVLDSADRYVSMDEEERQAAIDEMASGELIFPMAH